MARGLSPTSQTARSRLQADENLEADESSLRDWPPQAWRRLAASVAALSLLTIIGTAVIGCGVHRTGSIGAVLSRHSVSGAIHVRETPPEQAGARAGLIPGDRIKMIDGRLIDDLETPEILSLLRGPIGSHVDLTILRADQVVHLQVARSVLSTSRAAPSSRIDDKNVP